MRLTFIILGLITSILAVILAILPHFMLAFIPAILAFIFGLLGFNKSKKTHKPTHTTQLIFLLAIIALAIATYQSVFSTFEVDTTETLNLKEESKRDEVKDTKIINKEAEVIGSDIDISN